MLKIISDNTLFREAGKPEEYFEELAIAVNTANKSIHTIGPFMGLLKSQYPELESQWAGYMQALQTIRNIRDIVNKIKQTTPTQQNPSPTILNGTNSNNPV